MSESNEIRTAAWHMPEQFPSAKNAMFRAADKIDALAARVAELEAAQAVLTPRKCGTCQKAAEQMREAAAKLIEGKRLTQNEIDEGIIWADNCTDKFAEYIRAMPLPTCGDCNPLKPV